MISRPLIDLINSGRAVSITGSGISAEAGVPTWRGLFDAIAHELAQKGHGTRLARTLASGGHLPEAFEELANATSRADIHHRVTRLVTAVKQPARYHKQLVDWPFLFYITTNYDHLLEAASGGGLIAVGNRGTELHKIGSGNTGFVWHLHGGCQLSSDASDLLITRSDYTTHYPNSNSIDKLRACTATHQCVFIGFGFHDPDLNHVLEAIGRLGNPGLPHYAFIANRGSSADMRAHHSQLLANYNVEAIPYLARNDDHSDLWRILTTYAPFLVRRSISLGRPSVQTPTYDPVATSLNVQNSLDVGMFAKSGSLKATLLGARVVAHIRANPGGTEAQLEPLYRSGSPSREDVLECVRRLRASGAATAPPELDLTAQHVRRRQEAETQIEFRRDQFLESLRARVLAPGSGLDQEDGEAQSLVADAAAAFLDKLCRERGLGVAQNLATSDTGQASRRAVALIRHLPDQLARCRTLPEAQAVVRVVVDILTAPKEAEKAFLGLLCQAYFGQHLVGASETLARIDLDLVANGCYLLDASVLVRLLAVGAKAHESTEQLLTELRNCGATLVTTRLFLEETVEHAIWAADFVRDYGDDSEQVLAAVRGLGGYTPNEFLQGYFAGPSPEPSFAAYLGSALRVSGGYGITHDVVAERLAALGIETLGFEEWTGFHQGLMAKMRSVCGDIEARRQERGTFRHER